MMKVMGAIMLVLLVASVTMGFLLKKAYTDIGVHKAAVATATQALEDQKETLDAVQQLYEDQQVKTAEMQAARDEAFEERDLAVEQLQAFRGRLRDAATGRPTLVERKANRATKGVMCDFFELTGGEGC